MDEIKKCVGIFKLDGERMKDLKSNLLRWPVFEKTKRKNMSETKLLLAAAAGVFLSIPDLPHTFPKSVQTTWANRVLSFSLIILTRTGRNKKRPRLAVKPGASFFSFSLGEGKRLRFVSFTKTKKKRHTLKPNFFLFYWLFSFLTLSNQINYQRRTMFMSRNFDWALASQ